MFVNILLDSQVRLTALLAACVAKRWVRAVFRAFKLPGTFEFAASASGGQVSGWDEGLILADLELSGKDSKVGCKSGARESSD